jgi:hypothetical protein
MNKTNWTALEIHARRLANLRANGEDVRNTVAWRDALAEGRMLRMHGMIP